MSWHDYVIVLIREVSSKPEISRVCNGKVLRTLIAHDLKISNNTWRKQKILIHTGAVDFAINNLFV